MKYYVHVVYSCVWVQTHTPEFPCHTNLFVTSLAPAFPEVRDIAGSPLTLGRISTVLWLSCPRCLLVYNGIFRMSALAGSHITGLSFYTPWLFSRRRGPSVGFYHSMHVQPWHVFQKWCSTLCEITHRRQYIVHSLLHVNQPEKTAAAPSAGTQIGFHKLLQLPEWSV